MTQRDTAQSGAGKQRDGERRFADDPTCVGRLSRLAWQLCIHATYISCSVSQMRDEFSSVRCGSIRGHRRQREHEMAQLTVI
jgi:hypothetical protein